jgi:hypothetical protein
VIILIGTIGTIFTEHINPIDYVVNLFHEDTNTDDDDGDDEVEFDEAAASDAKVIREDVTYYFNAMTGIKPGLVSVFSDPNQDSESTHYHDGYPYFVVVHLFPKEIKASPQLKNNPNVKHNEVIFHLNLVHDPSTTNKKLHNENRAGYIYDLEDALGFKKTMNRFLYDNQLGKFYIKKNNEVETRIIDQDATLSNDIPIPIDVRAILKDQTNFKTSSDVSFWLKNRPNNSNYYLCLNLEIDNELTEASTEQLILNQIDTTLLPRKTLINVSYPYGGDCNYIYQNHTLQLNDQKNKKDKQFMFNQTAQIQ